MKTAQVTPVPNSASKFAGAYAVTEGVFNPWIEVAPVDEDFYHLFYDPDIRPEILIFEIVVDKTEVTLTLNRSTVLHARLDGCWECGDIRTIMPPLSKYAATARFVDSVTLRISLRWLNSWCCPEMTFQLTGETDLFIRCEKDMLHQGRAPFTHEARARKIR